jgi:dienelactone hydrolase
VGYCFGGKYVVRHLHPGKFDVGYTAHPTHIDADELKSMKGPLAIAAAEIDVLFSSEKRQETETILKESNFPWQMNLYSGVQHGFAVRGDDDDPVARYAMNNAFLQALEWFKEHLIC